MKIPESLKWRATGKTLGQGGQATVYEVVDKHNEDGKTYALKVLARGRPQQAYERFHREITALNSINHPFIIRIVEHSEANENFQYFVMEHNPGAVPLARLLGDTANGFYGDALSSLDLFCRLAEVVRACESLTPKVVHRDLSPANVLILPDLSIKVIDFGLCQFEGYLQVRITSWR